ncbi:MAG: AAA family ATPase [Rhodoglobus sp.]
MYLRRVVIKNYRAIRDATVDFKPGLTIIVGDNEAGKSTLLEAIQLAITGRLGGRHLKSQLHPLLFNMEACRAFIEARNAGTPEEPPHILIEVYFSDDDELVPLKGNNNSLREDAAGISLRIALADHLTEDFATYVAAAPEPHLLPTELFEVEWRSFADARLSGRRPLFRSKLIAAGTGDARHGTTRYLSGMVDEHLTDDEQLKLALAYRSMKQVFQRHDTVQKLNAELLSRRGEVSSKTLSLAMDVTSSTSWQHGIAAMLDDIPLGFVGSGEQAAVRVWLALDDAKEGAHLVMVEEPESHLSHSRLNVLLDRMCKQAGERQLIVTTHSSFVLNKLGLDELLLFNRSASLRLTELTPGTSAYFKKLPGHDTLRLVLATRVILVEGPSDELVVQRAYRDQHGKRPLDEGVDVLAVRSLSFERYLDIAVKLNKRVGVLVDNDGDVERVRDKYARFGEFANVTICFSDDANTRTLEPLLARHNAIDKLNRVLRKSFKSHEAAIKWMLSDKTEAALRIHDAGENLDYPECIARVVA